MRTKLRKKTNSHFINLLATVLSSSDVKSFYPTLIRSSKFPISAKLQITAIPHRVRDQKPKSLNDLVGSDNIMLGQPLHSSMTQTWANILCFKPEQRQIRTGANMDEKASRNGRSRNIAFAAEQGRWCWKIPTCEMLHPSAKPHLSTSLWGASFRPNVSKLLRRDRHITTYCKLKTDASIRCIQVKEVIQGEESVFCTQ